MGQVLFEQIESWHEGVLTQPKADLLVPAASPRGYNSYLTNFGAGTAVPAKRKGMTTGNATPITGSAVVLEIIDYKRQSSGAFTTYPLVVSNAGRLDLFSAGACAAWDSGSAAPFTSGTYYPDSAIANNMAFIVNGQSSNNKKATVVSASQKVQNFGITRPTVGTLAGAAGAAGTPSGTYELRVTYYNTNTGHESSISDTATATVTVTNQKISVTNIPTSSDTQVTQRNVYIRNTATEANFKRSSTMIVADNTTTTLTIDSSDTQRTILAPDTAENDPPPTLSVIAWHRSRMFGAGPTDPSFLYYSKLGLPEAFDPESFERINTDDGQKITTLHSAHDVLMIFKSDAFYVLDGDNPASWQVRLIDPEVGCVSHRSIQTIEGITYWWSEHGPMSWDGAGLPRPVGADLIGNTISTTTLNYAYIQNICSAVDEPRNHILWALPDVGQVVNTFVLPFNYRLQRWVSDRWDPMDVSAMAVVVDGTTQIPWVYFGNYLGQLFKFWDGTNDGVASGTTDGTFVSSSTAITTFTDATAAFDTTGGKLLERVMRIYNVDTTQEIARRKITANTATTLTFASVSGLTTGGTYGYEIGGPDFQWDTYWGDFDSPFWKKRFEFLYASVVTTGAAITVHADVFLDTNASDPARTFSFDTATGSGATWGNGVWNVSEWASPEDSEVIFERLRMAKTGRNWRVRIRNRMPDEPVTLLKTGMRAELLTDKR